LTDTALVQGGESVVTFGLQGNIVTHL